MALGEDAAAEVLKNLEEVEIQQVGYFMTRFTDIAPEEVDIVLEEFYRNSVTQEEGVNIMPLRILSEMPWTKRLVRTGPKNFPTTSVLLEKIQGLMP